MNWRNCRGWAAGRDRGGMAGALPEEAQEHARAMRRVRSRAAGFCGDAAGAGARCRRRLPEAGPWFTRRVMHAIDAQEDAMEETAERILDQRAAAGAADWWRLRRCC